MSQLLPQAFCWTKYGPEAGETADAILERKAREAEASGGIYLWGIGNSVLAGLIQLLKVDVAPRVVFSPMKAKPRAVDQATDDRLLWTAGRGLDGFPYRLPTGCTVTSRGALGVAKTKHFALVCRALPPSAEPLLVDAGLLRNIGSGAIVGASQVTAVVRQVAERGAGGVRNSGIKR